MSVWKVPGVDVEPEIEIELRGIFRSQYGDHIVGYNITHHEGRVSSPIKECKPHGDGKYIAITRSGRAYLINNKIGMGRAADAWYVWERFQQINNIEDPIDVTKEYITE